MMGKSHAMSASAVALGTAAIGIGPIDAGTTSLAVVALYTAVMVGGSLWPDWDSNSSTVVRSFGIFGRAIYQFVNAIGLLIYNITKTKRDKPKEGGHRTFFHTPVAAILTGFVISGLSSLPGTMPIFGKNYTTGQVFSLIIMWLFMYVGLTGIFEKSIKKARKKFGIYSLMLISLIATFLVGRFMPENENYWWLGIAAVLGIFIHQLGDMITKMGLPMLWPLKIRGKRWYDVSLPSFMRIEAGGAFENTFLFPLFLFLTILGACACIPGLNDLVQDGFRNLTGK